MLHLNPILSEEAKEDRENNVRTFKISTFHKIKLHWINQGCEMDERCMRERDRNTSTPFSSTSMKGGSHLLHLDVGGRC
jgi:hypothetical protein